MGKPKSAVGLVWVVERVEIRPGRSKAWSDLKLVPLGIILARCETREKAQEWLEEWRKTAPPGQRASVFCVRGILPPTYNSSGGRV